MSRETIKASPASRAEKRRGSLKRQRQLITPEGLALPLTVASRGARAGALLIDLMLFVVTLVVLQIVFQLLVGNTLAESGGEGAAAEFVYVVAVTLLFLLRQGYFLYFELGPRAATPGKRMLGIRVAARSLDGNSSGRLTAEMVVARNLGRDVEMFMPMAYLVMVLVGEGGQGGVAGWAAFVWLMVFLLFPFFNKDALRAGDLIAGTWVVEARQAKLEQALSLAPDRSTMYRFGPAELSVYGEHELQVLEGVLRQDNPEALREVAEAICRKIGWQLGAGDEREFLETFYTALRGHLESGMRFGKRKADKYA